MPTRNIVVVCSRSHEKKVNLGEILRVADLTRRRSTLVRSFEVFRGTPTRNIVVVCSGSHEKKVNLGEVFLSGSHEKKVNLGEVFP